MPAKALDSTAVTKKDCLKVCVINSAQKYSLVKMVEIFLTMCLWPSTKRDTFRFISAGHKHKSMLESVLMIVITCC